MKHLIIIVTLLALLLTVAGCGNGGDVGNRVGNNNTVNQVINEQMGKAESNSAAALPEPSGGSVGQPNSPATAGSGPAEVDYDLTSMGSDMVYATVYQMMTDPDTYIGKTFRMEGLYYPVYYEPTGKDYHYCLIQDALACCAQGLEFVWGDGSRIYPDDYPEEDAMIVVQGTFETYQDEGDEFPFCRLKDATMEIIQE